MSESNGVKAPAAGGNGLGIAALVLGLVAALVAFIPVVGIFLLWVPALVGLILGIIALAKNPKKVFGLIGVILAVVAAPIGIVTTTAGVGAAVSSAVEESQVKEVVYTVTGSGATANVTYSAWVDGKSTSKSEEVALPWSLTINPENAEGKFTISSFSVSAISGDIMSDTTVDLACSITQDGEVVSESSDNAAMAMVNCFG
jgi:hypothetical protein